MGNEARAFVAIVIGLSCVVATGCGSFGEDPADTTPIPDGGPLTEAGMGADGPDGSAPPPGTTEAGAPDDGALDAGKLDALAPFGTACKTPDVMEVEQNDTAVEATMTERSGCGEVTAGDPDFFTIDIADGVPFTVAWATDGNATIDINPSGQAKSSIGGNSSGGFNVRMFAPGPGGKLSVSFRLTSTTASQRYRFLVAQ